MQCRKYVSAVVGTVLALGLSVSLTAQEAKEAGAGAKKATEAEMMGMMMDMAKPGDAHKRLAEGVGEWSYVCRWWMNPQAPPSTSTGTCVSRTVMGGRYFISESKGKMAFPGPDGKMMEMDYQGTSTEGYDNAKKKYVASWIDNLGTGIMSLEGTYDEQAKTLTYLAEYEMIPGVKTKMREVIITKDKDHRSMEFYEVRGGKEVKMMEIDYTRKG